MSHFAIALLITAAFALLGWAVAGVTAGGAVAGFIVAFLLFYGIGPAAFAVLFVLFAITWLSTRLGRARKQRLGIAERRRGRRTAGQVLANLGVAGAFAALAMAYVVGFSLSPNLDGLAIPIVTAAIAALAEAAADTVSSECGEAFSDTAFLVPRLRRVPAGTDGAITAIGTIAGIVASAAIAGLAGALHVLPLCAAVVATLSGIGGMFVDTILGATFERRHAIGNNAVNLASTFAAAVFAIVLVISVC